MAKAQKKLPLYSVGTWNYDLHYFTPQVGVDPWLNITRKQLLVSCETLRNLGYSIDDDPLAGESSMEGGNDPSMIILETNGMTEWEVRRWMRQFTG